MNTDWQNILSISGILLTIFFGILSYVFYRKSINNKKILISLDSTILISEDFSNYDGFQISYNNEKINTLTNSVIVITNIGYGFIDKNDFIADFPITFSTSNKFYHNNVDGNTILTSNKKVIASLHKIDDSTLQLSFNFLKHNDTIKIILLHDGAINIEGELKNGSIRKINYNKNDYFMYKRYERIFKTQNYLMKRYPLFSLFVLCLCILLYFCIFYFLYISW